MILLLYAEPTPKNDELINFDDDGDGWAEEDADWGDLEESKLKAVV